MPTGLTADGRPTAVQLWGRAVAHDAMFDDAAAARHDAAFLHAAARAAAAIHADAALRRVDAPLVADIVRAPRLPGATHDAVSKTGS